jgi:hypothetical protein
MLKSFVGSFDNTLVSAIISSNTMNCYSIGMLFYLMAYMTLYPGCLPWQRAVRHSLLFQFAVRLCCG